MRSDVRANNIARNKQCPFPACSGMLTSAYNVDEIELYEISLFDFNIKSPVPTVSSYFKLFLTIYYNFYKY